MSDLPSKPQGAHPMLYRLMKDTHITEDQARELIALIGPEWSSLVREARILASKNSPNL